MKTIKEKTEKRSQRTDIKFQRKLFLLLFLFSILCFLFSVEGCGKKEVQKEADIIPVKCMKIKLQDFKETLDYVDNIKAKAEVMVYPKVGGKIIEKLKEDGAEVNKDDVIAYIDRDEVGFKFEKAPVESPIKGVIGRIYVDIGTNVNTQMPVAMVVDMDTVYINLDIPEINIPKIRIGEEANIRVDAYPGETFKGSVTKMSPVCDLDTRTAPIEITIDNKDHRLRSGMFAKVSLIVEDHKNVPILLKEAIMGREPNQYVYVIEGNVAVLRNVKLGIHHGPYYEVKEGIKENDVVAIIGQQRLYEGAHVNCEIDETK